VLIERPRAFFLEPDPDDGDGEIDRGVNDELRAIVEGGFGTEGALVASLLSALGVGIGIVGLSGSGVLLHLLPCL
jgi:hypothetical protein